MLFSSLKSVFPCFTLVLDNFYLFVVVVLLVCLGAFITGQRVGAPRPPAITPSFPLTGKTVLATTLLTTPGIGLPVEVMDLCATYFTHKETDLPVLVVLLLLCSNLLGRLAAWGVRDKLCLASQSEGYHK